MKAVWLVLACCAATLVTSCARLRQEQPMGGQMTPTSLRCEYAENPLGIDTRQPRLSWALESRARGQRQNAYRVLVASEPAVLKRGKGDIWDSGKVESAQSTQVMYAGAPLASGQRCYWRVCAWDESGQRSRWSDVAWFEAGLFEPKDWSGRWIGGDGLLRKEFAAAKPVKSARAYVTGLGYYELHLNGERVGDHLLDPGWTTYTKRVLYAAYDVTEALQQGENAAGIVLGNGWYNPLTLRMWGHINPREHLTVGAPRALLQLNIEYTDGTRDCVVTDESWRVGQSPIVKNSLYLGEVYDARLEQPGWDKPGFNDGAWQPATIAEDPLGPLQAQMAPPIRVGRIVKPVALTAPQPGVFIFDMGENFAGRAWLRVKGPAGATVTMRYGELLYPDGTLNGMTSVCGQIKEGRTNGGPDAPPTAFQSDTYILSGSGKTETYAPRFTFRGFRYIEVTGYPGTPPLDALQGEALHSDVEPAGSFHCSNRMFNQLQTVVRRTLLSNLFSVQSDCPHREKFGYGGDIVATSEMAILNFDMAQFYTKAVRDFADAARPNGALTETAPFVGIADGGLGEQAGPIGWGTAHPLLLWHVYLYYGDRSLLEEQYDVAKRWLEFIQAASPEHLVAVGIGDHESLVPKQVPLTSTAFYWLNAHLLSEIAALLGKTDDMNRFAALADAIQQAFNANFLAAGTGRYADASQASQSFAVHMGLVPDEEREAALAVLVDDIMTAHNGHLSTGIFGTKFMLDALSENGRADVAYTLANQRAEPGWGHMLKEGATTLWETWKFSDDTFSHNHPMFGSVSEWFIKHLGGIQPDSEKPGFEHVHIRPVMPEGLQHVKAELRTLRGTVACEWSCKPLKSQDGRAVSMTVAIPANCTASVRLPKLGAAKVLVEESGHPLWRDGAVCAPSKGVASGTEDESAVTLEIGGGKYRFLMKPE